MIQMKSSKNALWANSKKKKKMNLPIVSRSRRRVHKSLESTQCLKNMKHASLQNLIKLKKSQTRWIV